MGLVLLIPGLVFLVNGTEWFPGEDTVGLLLVILWILVMLVNVRAVLLAHRQMRKIRQNPDVIQVRSKWHRTRR
jgi:hypothetical protein